jgi:hypothetical protein
MLSFSRCDYVGTSFSALLIDCMVPLTVHDVYE